MLLTKVLQYYYYQCYYQMQINNWSSRHHQAEDLNPSVCPLCSLSGGKDQKAETFSIFKNHVKNYLCRDFLLTYCVLSLRVHLSILLCLFMCQTKYQLLRIHALSYFMHMQPRGPCVRWNMVDWVAGLHLICALLWTVKSSDKFKHLKWWQGAKTTHRLSVRGGVKSERSRATGLILTVFHISF